MALLDVAGTKFFTCVCLLNFRRKLLCSCISSHFISEVQSMKQGEVQVSSGDSSDTSRELHPVQVQAPVGCEPLPRY